MASTRKTRKGKEPHRSARAVANEEAQNARQSANRKAGGLTPWAATKEARRVRRAQDPSIVHQPRNRNGMIVLRDGRLKFDTERARNNALVTLSQEEDERAAVELEKRKSRDKAKTARANKPKAGAVTVRKTK